MDGGWWIVVCVRRSGGSPLLEIMLMNGRGGVDLYVVQR